MFQSTHPRRVWLDADDEEHEAEYVSIHTPTKGVTIQCTKIFHFRSVSIHTPTKGVTQFVDYPCGSRWCFNPHTHEGCDFNLNT